MIRITQTFTGVMLCFALLHSVEAQPVQETGTRQIEAWITTPDRSVLFGKQPEKIAFTNAAGRGGTPIVIDEQQTMQTIDGLGFALTGESAELMMKMSKPERAKLLTDLFATNDNSIGVSYIRLTVGSFRVQYRGQYANLRLQPGAVGTYVWDVE